MSALKNQHVRCLCIYLTLLLGSAQASADSPARSYRFDIGAETLSQALRNYGQISGQQIIFTEDLVEGKTVPALRGEFTAEEALQRLLKGTGLTAERSPSGALMIRHQLDRTSADSSGTRLAYGGIGGAGADQVRASSDSATPPQRVVAGTFAPTDTSVLPTLEEVIVTAQKRPERLLTVAAPVTALGAAELSRTEAVRLDDFTAQVPGLNLISDREGQTQIILRGITTGSPVNSTVATYIDDIPFGSSTNAALGGWLSPDLDLGDLQRIEVLRGPQGTLYGASSLGGLIKYVTTPADPNEFHVRAELDGNSVDAGGQGYGVRGMVNLPLVSDMLGLRVSAYDRRDPGYIDDPELDRHNLNNSEVDGGRAALLWKPSSQLSVNLTAVIQDLQNGGSSDEDVNVVGTHLTPSVGDLEHVRYTNEPLDVHYRLYSASINYDLQWADLVSATSYSTLHETAVTDLTDSLGPILSGAFGVPNAGFDVGSDLILRKETQELRLESPEGSQLEWRAGFFFTHEHSTRDEPSNAFLTGSQEPLPVPAAIYFDHQDSRYTEYAGFGDLTYYFIPQFDLTAGVRYSSNQQRFGEVSGGLLSGGTTVTAQDSSDDSTTFLVTPRFRLDDNNMIYARVASGYRPGGPNSVTPAQLAVGVPTSYKPDTLTDYDPGYKASLLERKLTLDLSAFYIDWRDVQIETDYSGVTISGNGGTARSDGLEASAVLAPLRGLNIALNLTYTDAQLTQNAPGVNGKDGDELPNVPKWSAALNVDQDFTLTGTTSCFIGGGVHYVGERVSGFVTGSPADFVRPIMPAYTTVDLRTGLNYQNLTFELYAKNVGNERGFNNITSLALSAYQAPFTASVIQPRTIGFSAIAKF
jgi:iron complex outermembrane receptor protein